MLVDRLFADSLSPGGLTVRNPGNGETIATVRAYTAEEIPALIARMEIAGKSWAARTAKDRAAVLRRWFELILTHRDELAAICTAESGKPLAESVGEVTYAASFIEWYAEEGKRAYGEVIPTFAADKRILTIKQPIGVTAAITPWNFPVAMITRKVGPALAAGCPMIVKPAEATPLSALAMATLAREAGLPEDLYLVVPTNDPAAIGQVFCSHPIIRKLSFTGSTAVGKILLQQCAGTVKRTSMELGGNAPFIVFDDADLDAAIDGVMISKYRNAGQTCVCANRILVQSGIHDRFVERLTERAAALVVGQGDKSDTQLGPLINSAAIAKVERLVAEAVSQGAQLQTGGHPHAAGPGFFEPTVLTQITPAMALANNEIFGPVAAVMRFETEEEAVRIANDTPYGLAAYVYARDIGRIWRMLEALEYGMVAVNEGVLSTEVAPFGGVKESGLGREGSHHGLDEYLELKYALLGGLAK